jgi:tRNA-Thr(GGU) m(6)t(6)A37 methyltransferase TsaA
MTTEGADGFPRRSEMVDERFEVRPIGRVESSLRDVSAAPRQGDEGAPPAIIRFRPDVQEGSRDIAAGDDLLVLTWLHLADRTTLGVHPRGEESRPLTGVFSTRSPDRPNPIGLHRVRVIAIGEDFIEVDALEAIDGTPVLDLKPVLGDQSER